MFRFVLFVITAAVGASSVSALEIKAETSAAMLRKAETLLSPRARPAPPVGALPDTEIATGTRNIRRAWLSEPTGRYGHAVLGDAIEAGGISARLDSGATATLRLDAKSVFEDRVPRLVDMDRDGRDEILVVRSFLDAGAALSLITETDGKLAVAAMAAPIGTAHRWLNPVGTGDFDGDGTIEAAAVITPHIGGTLQLYEWRGDKLVADHARSGFSNHAMGSRELGLAAVADLNRDGVPDMVVPDASRAALVGLTFAGGTYRELFRRRLAGRLATAVRAVDLNGDGRVEIIYGTSQGFTVLGITP